mmetsp:Transcript_38642/g.119439  ORF Transcript_38642/g.119439 Transcript_38642/m.119439 type:complete len:366 (-) Transcript_38642:49-1146(-)
MTDARSCSPTCPCCCARRATNAEAARRTPSKRYPPSDVSVPMDPERSMTKMKWNWSRAAASLNSSSQVRSGLMPCTTGVTASSWSKKRRVSDGRMPAISVKTLPSARASMRLFAAVAAGSPFTPAAWSSRTPALATRPCCGPSLNTSMTRAVVGLRSAGLKSVAKQRRMPPTTSSGMSPPPLHVMSLHSRNFSSASASTWVPLPAAKCSWGPCSSPTSRKQLTPNRTVRVNDGTSPASCDESECCPRSSWFWSARAIATMAFFTLGQYAVMLAVRSMQKAMSTTSTPCCTSTASASSLTSFVCSPSSMRSTASRESWSPSAAASSSFASPNASASASAGSGTSRSLALKKRRRPVARSRGWATAR